MSRLGINAEEYFEADDFRDVTHFNTQDTLNALGIATDVYKRQSQDGQTYRYLINNANFESYIKVVKVEAEMCIRDSSIIRHRL